MTAVYVAISLVICFVYFQFLDWLLMDAQGLDYFYMFRQVVSVGPLHIHVKDKAVMRLKEIAKK